MSRPTWVAGASACPSFSGFSAVDAYPIRSPLVVADFLGAQLAPGRSFAEIGTRNGDVMSCVSHFTPRVTAIEMDPGYCAQLRQRGFGVACSMFEDLADADFPVADVYYWWPSDAGGQNEVWLWLIARALRKRRREATVYIGFDGHWSADMKVLPPLARKYNATVERLFFDEGGRVAGKAQMVTGGRETPFEASLAKPFYDRPGHWGVFLLARFSIDDAFWARMDRRPFHHPAVDGHTRRGEFFHPDTIAARRQKVAADLARLPDWGLPGIRFDPAVHGRGGAGGRGGGRGRRRGKGRGRG